MITYFVVSDDAGAILDVKLSLTAAQESARWHARTGPCATYVHTIGIDPETSTAPAIGQSISMKGKLDRFTSAHATEDELEIARLNRRERDCPECLNLKTQGVFVGCAAHRKYTSAQEIIDRRLNEALTDLATGKETKR